MPTRRGKTTMTTPTPLTKENVAGMNEEDKRDVWLAAQWLKQKYRENGFKTPEFFEFIDEAFGASRPESKVQPYQERWKP